MTSPRIFALTMLLIFVAACTPTRPEAAHLSPTHTSTAAPTSTPSPTHTAAATRTSTAVFNPVPTATSGATPTALFVITDPAASACEIPEESLGSKLALGDPGFCLVWADCFNDELGFRIILKYPKSGEVFVYEVGPDAKQLTIPEAAAPRLGESQEQFLRRHVWELWVYALLSQGPSLVDGMAAEADNPDLLRLPTATPEPIVSSLGLRSPRHIIEPLVAAQALRFDSWSPDGEWLAYWVGERDGQLPSHLAFVNVRSAKPCPHEGVIAQDFWSGRVTWRDDGGVIAFVDQSGQAFGGMPCGSFAPLENVSLPELDAIIDVAPDGRYRARTLGDQQGQVIHKVTTITEAATGQIIVTLSWDVSIHSPGPGPRWLTNELFLIGLTMDQGALYISLPDASVGDVLADLAGLYPGEIVDVWRLDSQADHSTGEFHLLIEQAAGSPPLLYHSERHLFEELPFMGVWPFGLPAGGSSFSPDGKWLLLRQDSAEGLGEDYWLRPVDPPGSAAVKVAAGVGFRELSPDSTRMTFDCANSACVLTFPGGDFVGRWVAAGYDLEPLAWSPDGSRFAAIGYPLASSPEALFVIEP